MTFTWLFSLQGIVPVFVTGLGERWLPLGIVTLVTFGVSWVIYQIFLSPLANIPGPFLGKILPSIVQPAYRNGRMFRHSMENHRRYGPMVRLGCNTVSFIDFPTIQQIYQSYEFIKAPIWYQGFEMFGEGFFTTARADFHRKRKRVILPAFTLRALRVMEKSIIQFGPVNLITGDPPGDATEGAVVNIYHTLTLLSADVITELTLGKSVQLLSRGSHPITEWFHATTRLVVIFNVFPFLKGARWGFRELRGLLQDFEDYVSSCIQERRQRLQQEPPAEKESSRGPSGRLVPDILGNLILSVDPDTGEKLTDQELKCETISLLFGGSDTVASTMSTVLLQLFRNPHVFTRLQEEIITTFPKTVKAMGIDYETIRHQIPLMEAVISETLRIMPSSPGTFWRTVPAGGRVLFNHYLPAGTEVGGAAAAYHIGPEWSDPMVFNPDRFLGVAGEKSYPRVYTFSLGPRQCLGRALAFREISLILVTLFRFFEISILDEEELNKQWLHFVTLRPHDKQLNIAVKPRPGFIV
ncbi:cytochrome P450 [Dimargaris cristalligena]|uniref:Cytochrome P450 n=1 Tax=Dimargaris cristalligena TaxID=215637 RepID=A0A4V1J4L4_9FUNG|nr:cytochrome P450 [Dimargaris cristalligena]|eukprot:RKP35969.1 cytochrome P450 [Dimargaris cristalligena]